MTREVWWEARKALHGYEIEEEHDQQERADRKALRRKIPGPEGRETPRSATIRANEARGREVVAKALGVPVERWRRHGVVKAMTALPAPAVDWNDAESLWLRLMREMSIQPDAYAILPSGHPLPAKWNPRCHNLVAVEIETTFAMPDHKGFEYGRIWDAFWESYGWELHLIVVDRHWQWHELDLDKLYHDSFEPDPD